MRRNAGQRAIVCAVTYHWAKVAAEIARLSPRVEMDMATLRAIVAEEKRRRG